MLNDAVRRWFEDRGVLCVDQPNIRDHLRFEPTIRLFGSPSLMGVTMGAFSYVSPVTNINQAAIGRYCSIGDNVVIGPTQHPNDWLTTSPLPYTDVFDTGIVPSERHEELERVTIGNDVWIGSNAAIMGGVTIGDGAIIGYGSVVTRDVAPYAIVGGVPARVIRMRFPDDVIEQLLSTRWWQFNLVHQTGDPIQWRDPLAALGDIERKASSGQIAKIPATLHRIYRESAETYGFEKLA